MLRSFRLGNHRSFRDEHELLLMPALPGDARPVVPVAAIYGANASGKSNLLHGLAFMQLLVCGRSMSAAAFEPYKLGAGPRLGYSVFVVEVVVDGVPYTYGFRLTENAVAEEWLYAYPAKRKRLLFERSGAELKVGGTVVDSKAKFDVLEELIRPDRLLLSVCASLMIGPLMPVFEWFASGMTVRKLGTQLPQHALGDFVGRYLSRKPENLPRVVSLLGAADVGVVDLVVEGGRESPALRSDPRSPERELKLLHGPGREPFDLRCESSGTLNWLELLPQVLDAVDGGKVMIVDEIDASLHPLLTAQLVKIFRDRQTNPGGAQLIFTTHDTSLLGTMLGDQVLERDEIWFVEKDAEGASQLYPLTDFKPRKDQNTERRYLNGSYGAVPVLGDFLAAVGRG
ncbi:ATP-binding protein [Amycolatopsis sp. NPDC021455]|uniref:AAA family ATPase n=1 Tax=Amycolatopsis sp. NPDC021455 TaxID=3154901 RepID=UPI0033D796B4